MEARSLGHWHQLMVDHNPHITGQTDPMTGDLYYAVVACSCGGKYNMVPMCCGQYENGECCGHPDPEPEFEHCDGIATQFMIHELEQYLIDNPYYGSSN